MKRSGKRKLLGGIGGRGVPPPPSPGVYGGRGTPSPPPPEKINFFWATFSNTHEGTTQGTNIFEQLKGTELGCLWLVRRDLYTL